MALLFVISDQTYALFNHAYMSSKSTICYLIKNSSSLNYLFRSFPSIALCIPTAHNFTRDLRARIKKMAAFSLRLDLTMEVNRHFLANEYGDLPFFFLLF